MKIRLVVLAMTLFACHHDAKPTSPVGSAGSGSGASAPVPEANHADATPPAPGEAPSVTKMRGFRDHACACKTAPCVNDVQDDLINWAYHTTETGQPTEADAKTADELMSQFEKCVVAAGGKL